MSEKIDYKTFLPAKKSGEYYIVAYSGTYYAGNNALLNTGEMVSSVLVCEYKETVNRIVHEEGGKYIGIGVIHA